MIKESEIRPVWQSLIIVSISIKSNSFAHVYNWVSNVRNVGKSLDFKRSQIWASSSGDEKRKLIITNLIKINEIKKAIIRRIIMTNRFDWNGEEE
jgi:hypothetical protein